MVTRQQLKDWIWDHPSNDSTWYLWCQRLIWNVCNDWGSLNKTYQTASEAYRADATVIESKDPSTAPPGAMHWLEWKPDGHVMLELGGGEVFGTGLSRVPFAERWATGAGTMNIHDVIARSGLRYLGWSRTNGVNSVVVEADTPAPLGPKQRRVVDLGPGDHLKGRADAGSSFAEVGTPLDPGDVGNFVAWKYGEAVDGENRWLRGISDRYFSLRYLEPRTVDGLLDENAATIGPKQRRVVGAEQLRGRAQTTTASDIVDLINQNEVHNFTGWKRGQLVDGEDRWLKRGDAWYSLRYLEPRTVDGLDELGGGTPPPPDADEEARHTPVMVTPAASAWPAWIRYEENIDPDVGPTTNTDAYRYYGEEYFPEESHVHWWGQPGQAGTHDSNDKYLSSQPELGTNYLVSAGRVTLKTPLDKLAYNTGRRNPRGWKTENAPELTDLGYLTLAAVHYLVESANPRLRGEPVRLHSEFANTGCSKIDVARVRALTEQFFSGELDIATGRPPVAPPAGDTVTVDRARLQAVHDELGRILGDNA